MGRKRSYNSDISSDPKPLAKWRQVEILLEPPPNGYDNIFREWLDKWREYNSDSPVSGEIICAIANARLAIAALVEEVNTRTEDDKLDEKKRKTAEQDHGYLKQVEEADNQRQLPVNKTNTLKHLISASLNALESVDKLVDPESYYGPMPFDLVERLEARANTYGGFNYAGSDWPMPLITIDKAMDGQYSGQQEMLLSTNENLPSARIPLDYDHYSDLSERHFKICTTFNKLWLANVIDRKLYAEKTYSDVMKAKDNYDRVWMENDMKILEAMEAVEDGYST
ncbi:hypothetical protein DL89DRAFT_257840 [Linderina pennispora]|uniref:Uncharacterized protein n=1 Tax=Linderina pennispora TaxID=61395 RepID=A0A1Y1W8N6_9FUNG|nr:uncharacterized protein DL89DRAFT_257840 [Linderina pennispora]ORX69606.1 hypothetical protein DL89DRAFT_257840 [Linderina pennispora]